MIQTSDVLLEKLLSSLVEIDWAVEYVKAKNLLLKREAGSG